MNAEIFVWQTVEHGARRETIYDYSVTYLRNHRPEPRRRGFKRCALDTDLEGGLCVDGLDSRRSG